MKILLAGCGHMGGAMLRGWLGSRDKGAAVTRIDVIDPVFTGNGDARVRIHRDAEEWTRSSPPTPDMAVLAVKPQVMDQVGSVLGPHLPEGVPILSIAAGIPLARLASLYGANRPAVRAMPNTPGAIGRGITAYIKNEKTNQKHIGISVSLLSALGDVVQLPDENMMDAVTALSGSGPAYVFILAEVLEKAGLSMGLPSDLAAILARQTVTGAAALMEHERAQSPAALRQAVTSPNGTTAAALGVLQENQALETLFRAALEAARQRSRDLAQGK